MRETGNRSRIASEEGHEAICLGRKPCTTATEFYKIEEWGVENGGVEGRNSSPQLYAVRLLRER